MALVDTLTRLPHREYSIASVPVSGRIDLLVRQARLDDGRLGLGSGWLTAHAPIGSVVQVRIRENRAFHGPDHDCPVILIGNGTGLAGLRAHIAARATAARHRNWLLFGERTAAHDFHFRDDVQRWQQKGVLTRVDVAFSRDEGAAGTSRISSAALPTRSAAGWPRVPRSTSAAAVRAWQRVSPLP